VFKPLNFGYIKNIRLMPYPALLPFIANKAEPIETMPANGEVKTNKPLNKKCIFAKIFYHGTLVGTERRVGITLG
jgi:hypothetical protein